MTEFEKNGRTVRFWAKMGLFLTVFAPEWRKRDFFGKILKCHFRTLCNFATLCKKTEQTYERILRYKMYARTDGRR